MQFTLVTIGEWYRRSHQHGNHWCRSCWHSKHHSRNARLQQTLWYTNTIQIASLKKCMCTHVHNFYPADMLSFQSDLLSLPHCTSLLAYFAYMATLWYIVPKNGENFIIKVHVTAINCNHTQLYIAIVTLHVFILTTALSWSRPTPNNWWGPYAWQV